METTHGEYERLERAKPPEERGETPWPGAAKKERLGVLSDGDFFGELAILLPHKPQGVKRRRTVYRDPSFSELYVELWCLSYDDVAELERMRPPIRRMLKPYKRQAIAARHRHPSRPPRSTSRSNSSSNSTSSTGPSSVNGSALSTDLSAISSRTSSYDVDASGHALGSVSSEVAQLRGQMNDMQGQLRDVIQLLKQQP